MALYRRLLNVFRGGRLAREFDDELEFHREMRLRRARERGLDAAEATTEVTRRMGNLSVAKEEMQDARVVPWLAASMQDLRHGVVLLWRDRRLSGLIVLVLALGIGGTAAIFTLLKAAFLDPLPFRDASRLVTIYGRNTRHGIAQNGPTIPEFLDIRERSRSFEHMAFLDHRDFQITGGSEPVRVFAARVTASFFPVLGATAAMGRTFTEEENRPGKTNAVVISDGFWRTKLGADPQVLGRPLRLNGAPHIVVGVMPPDFSFDYPTLGVPEATEIYVPFEMSDVYMLRSGPHANLRRVRVLARLREGANASADLDSAAGYLASTYPNLYRGPRGESGGFSLYALPLRDAIVGRQRPLLWLLLGSAGVLLLIACANAAQLLLARGMRRAREVAIRSALGASRPRLIRQFLMEGLTLAAVGGFFGLLSSGAIAQVIVGLFPAQSPIFASAKTDLRVVAFTAAVALLAAVAFAVLPALKASAWTPGPSLTTRRSVAEGNRWRHAMIAAEAALSVFLLCGASLVGQNLWKLVSQSSGFDPANVTVMQMRLPYAREQALNPAPMLAYREYLERVSTVGRVISAAVVTGLPLRGAAQTTFRIEGAPEPAGGAPPRAFVQSISPDYFRTLRIPILGGRSFRDDDRQGRPNVAIVNREFVRRFDLGPNPIGRRIRIGATATIVGVVGDVRMSPLSTAAEPQIYISYLQEYEPNIYFVVRSEGPAPMMEIKEAIYSAHSDQAVFNAVPMADVLSRSVAEPRFQVFLIGAFSLLALAMAASGMYSVVSCLVSQRTSEVAIRMALGADRAAIMRTILGSTALWVLAGLAAGLGLGVGARGLVRTLSSTAVEGSPWIYALVAIFFAVVTLAAAYAPVRRAGRLDPATALRCE